MTKDEFSELFLSNIRKAMADAETKVGVPLSQEFHIELHGGGVAGEILPLDLVIDIMWLGENRFYRIIDIAVIAVTKGMATVFVRISGHQPSEFERTWNTPKGNGPFKLLGTALNLRIEN